VDGIDYPNNDNQDYQCTAYDARLSQDQPRLLIVTMKRPRRIARRIPGKSRKGIGALVIEVVCVSDFGAAIVH
jgi:hypothetical protein